MTPEEEGLEEVLRKPYLTLPGVTGMPPMCEILASIPAEAQHRFESAGEFVTRLATRVSRWREQLPEDEQPVILALLPNGGAVEVWTATARKSLFAPRHGRRLAKRFMGGVSGGLIRPPRLLPSADSGSLNWPGCEPTDEWFEAPFSALRRLRPS